MKTIDYKIVRADSSSQLEKAVIHQLKMGYIPQGGVICEKTIWYQAMIWIKE